jgi:molybdate transport system substrate-binding protein
MILKSLSRYIMFLIVLFVLSGCSEADQTKTEITISSAASLKDAMTEIKELYEKQNNDVSILMNFGSSGTLKMQIEQGGPADLFFSASEDHFDDLLDKGMIKSNSHKKLLSNSLVLITPINQNSLENVSDLTKEKIKNIAIGIPESVPAGRYSKEVLVALGIWGNLEDKVIYTKDVRQALTYIETGNVDAGIVYKTDAMGSKKVKKVFEIDNKLHSPINYPVGVLEGTKYEKEAIAFYQFLQGKTARKVFIKNGFQIMD